MRSCCSSRPRSSAASAPSAGRGVPSSPRLPAVVFPPLRSAIHRCTRRPPLWTAHSCRLRHIRSERRHPLRHHKPLRAGCKADSIDGRRRMGDIRTV
uniref:Uncharacterized protein n=1 Tax=Arundo donax TaxID=35708 RepID=A0A0A9DW56_ARUDO